MSSYLITGCSQGLGLAMVQQLNKFPADSVSLVIATCRSSTPPAALQEAINASKGRVVHVAMDITSDDSVKAAVEKSKSLLGDKGLDILVNNAGLTAQSTSAFLGDVDDLTSCFNTNVVAVHRTIKAFLPLLRSSKDKKIINVSSAQGSCYRAERIPHSYAHAPDYKISKAALNMLGRQWSNSLRAEGFCVLALSPGHLQTLLGTFNGKIDADLPVEVGAEKTLDIITSCTAADNGKFKNIKVDGWERYQGEDVEW